MSTVNKISNVNLSTVNSPAFTSKNKKGKDEIQNIPVREENLDDFLAKTQQNVHPLTIIASLGAVFIAAKSASKIVPMIRKGGVKIAEIVSGFVVKAFSKVANFVKKDSFNPQKPLDEISKISKALMVDNNALKKEDKLDKVTNKKVLKKVQKHLGDVIGKKKAQKLVDTLKEHKIVNAAGIFDFVVSSAIGLSVIDRISDKTENALDGIDIKTFIQALEEV